MASIMRRMNVISRCESIYRTEQLEEDMPGFFHSYVLAICGTPGMNQEKLARHLCFHKSKVTRHLARLEQNGYIERKVCPEDKRELLVYPTEKMTALHPEVMKITREWNKLVAAGISEEEMEVFHRVLDRMVETSREIVYGKE